MRLFAKLQRALPGDLETLLDDLVYIVATRKREANVSGDEAAKEQRREEVEELHDEMEYEEVEEGGGG